MRATGSVTCVCDIQNARNLALAYVRGDVRDFVWTPSDECSEYRDVLRIPFSAKFLHFHP